MGNVTGLIPKGPKKPEKPDQKPREKGGRK